MQMQPASFCATKRGKPLPLLVNAAVANAPLPC